MGGVQVPCLVDKMVSTITESWFVANFGSWGQEQLRLCHWLKLRAANGLSIPYIGQVNEPLSRDENETRRNVNAGHVTMTIIKCIMQYC